MLSLAGILALVACGGGSSPLTDAPSDVAFGDVLVGTSASRIVKVTNTAAAPMTILDVTATGAGITATGPALPVTLAAGTSTDLAIRFAPDTSGDVSGAVYVRSDLLAEPFAVATYTGKGVLPSSQIGATPSAVDFGDVTVGASASRTVTLTNAGSKAVTITTASVSSAAVTTSGLALPATLAPGASKAFQLVFRPAAAGATAGHVAVRAEPSRPLAVVEFRGNAPAPAPAPAPSLSASPAQLDFQDVPLGQFSTEAVTLSNASAEPVTISTVTATGAGVSASGLDLPAVVAPGASRTLSVRFTPPAIGPASGSVSALAPGGAPLVVVPCAARGVAAPGITSVTVRDASVDASRSVQLVADVVATGTIDTSVTWKVESGSLGTVDPTSGVYTAPAAAGAYRVLATSNVDPSKQGVGVVTVVAPAPPPPPPPPPSGVVPAFPGAQGGGALSVGGRGGRVIEVTNLNDSGTGSLRACVTASGPRICVFRVGGTISLSSGLVVSNPYLTIAGQTAPGGGIQIIGTNICNYDPMLGIRTHDVTVRYVRVRKGYCASTPVNGGGGVSIWSGSYNVIIDHSSIFWSQDENFCVWGNVTPSPRAVTSSWNIIAESFSTAFGIGAETREVNDGMTGIDIHHTYIANNSHRQPLAGNASLRLVNNIIYNYNFYATQVEGGIRADIIGNVYKRGPSGTPLHEITVYPTGYANTATGSPSLYVQGNKGPSHFDPGTDGWGHMVWQVSRENGTEVQVLPTTFRRATVQPATGIEITPDSAATLDASLLPVVGASRRLDCSGNWVGSRDSADARVVSDYWATTGRSAVKTQADVGPFPTIASGTACVDTDHDGMPDAWESSRGLNPSDASDGALRTTDGFTNLEHYLNGQ